MYYVHHTATNIRLNSVLRNDAAGCVRNGRIWFRIKIICYLIIR